MAQEDFIEGEAIPGEIKVGIFLKSYNVLNDTAEVSTDDKTTYSTGEGARVVKSELSRCSHQRLGDMGTENGTRGRRRLGLAGVCSGGIGRVSGRKDGRTVWNRIKLGKQPTGIGLGNGIRSRLGQRDTSP